MTLALAAAGLLAAALVKGAIGFGFPVVATPLVALAVGVKPAIATLILPNLAMDALQARRRPGLRAAFRRHATLNVAGVLGMFAGTALLAQVSDRHALLLLGLVVVAFAAITASGLTPRVGPAWEPWLSPPVGFLAGVIGGVTNVPGTPLVLYFYAIGLDKAEFVRSVAVSFIVLKAAQLAAVGGAGLLTLPLLGLSLPATLLALTGFGLGLRLQDRLSPAAFNRAVLAALALLGTWLVVRALRG